MQPGSQYSKLVSNCNFFHKKVNLTHSKSKTYLKAISPLLSVYVSPEDHNPRSRYRAIERGIELVQNTRALFSLKDAFQVFFK